MLEGDGSLASERPPFVKGPRARKASSYLHAKVITDDRVSSSLYV